MVKVPVSRRAFLVGCGGVVASATLAWGLWKSQLWTPAAAGAYPVPECCSYVDYAGWMLTRADKERLLAQESIRRIESSFFDGNDIATEVVADADACATWCLTEPDCQGFSYAKPAHPAENFRSRCWLKGTAELTPVKNDMFTSGVR